MVFSTAKDILKYYILYKMWVTYRGIGPTRLET